MNDLTTEQKKALNDLSAQRNKSVLLGDLFQRLIDAVPAGGTPRNAVNAVMDLTLTGVVKDGETVTVNNPLSVGSDVYEFLTDAAQTKTAPTNIAVNVEANTTKATGTLTIDTQPTAGDKMTIGTRVYTFVPVGTDTADREITVGTDLATAQAAIVAAINGTDDHNIPHPLVRAGNFAVNASTITALIGGTAGNAIATTETFTAVTNVFGDVVLALGTDCPAADAITALVAAVTASDTQGVGATDENGDVVRFTADVAGVAGNAIVVGETLSNATFTGGATTLAGGANGTVGTLDQPLIDGDYLYVCVADNSISGKNWRRISLGAAF